MLLCINSGRPWEYFITMPGESSATINQMCWPVIIAFALFQGSRDFTCELSLIGHRSTSPCFERQVSRKPNVSLIGVFVAPVVRSSPAAN